MEKELILAAKSGDSMAFSDLIKKYAPVIDSQTASFYRSLKSGDVAFEDLRQESAVAFYRAVMSYDCEQNQVSFGLYAKICIKNRLISILRKNRSEKKHKTAELKDTVSQRSLQYDGKEIREAAHRLLTRYELEVFLLYLDGKSYGEIATLLSKNEKSVDNALFRAKAKLRSGFNM